MSIFEIIGIAIAGLLFIGIGSAVSIHRQYKDPKGKGGKVPLAASLGAGGDLELQQTGKTLKLETWQKTPTETPREQAAKAKHQERLSFNRGSPHSRDEAIRAATKAPPAKKTSYRQIASESPTDTQERGVSSTRLDSLLPTLGSMASREATGKDFTSA